MKRLLGLGLWSCRGGLGGLPRPSSIRRTFASSVPPTFLRDIDVVLLDCDGVIWRGQTIVPGSPEAIQRLRSAGKRVIFVTNSTKSRAQCLKKFDFFGIPAHENDIFSASYAAAAYFQHHPLPAGERVYVFGERGIVDEMDIAGIPRLCSSVHANSTVTPAPGLSIDFDPSIGAVVVGFDLDINYTKVQYAQLCLNHKESCRFIATNLDQVSHVTETQEWADTGAMVGAVAGCTGRTPTLVGKPSSFLMDLIVRQLAERGIPAVSGDRMLMVGDRLDTDILFGSKNGMKTALVLTGVTSFSRAQGVDPLSAPSVVSPDLATLCNSSNF